ncbi:MAG: hypothetical protein IID43_06260 [Planctomycetes bacterium]|nr:hypothetical protein [Planctomycetota bacterium]
MRAARACLSVHYLDAYGRPIRGTVVRSEFIGGSQQQSEWTTVELFLPAAPREAYTIGLIAWLLQEPKWNMAPKGRRHIPRRDVRGLAWFDQVTIYALPRVELTTGVPGNVLTPGGPEELRVLVADYEDEPLDGRLEIRAADGTLVETHRVATVIGRSTNPVGISVAHLSPGLYHAKLDVLAGGGRVVSRRLSFVRTATAYVAQGAARPFGVVIDPRDRSDVETELALLRNSSVRSAKLPVWSGLAEDAPTPAQRRSNDRLVQELVRSGFSLTGVFAGPPGEMMLADGAYPRPLLELLASDPSVWRDHLAAVVVPHAGAFHWWQVGPDAVNLLSDRESLPTALQQVREALREFVTIPQLVLPVSALVEPSAEGLPVEQVSLFFGSEADPDTFLSAILQVRNGDYERVSVYVEPLPVESYRHEQRLADWSQRILMARHGGASTVFVPQPWHTRDTSHGPVTEPTELYLILRTIADVVGGTAPGPRLRIAPGVYALAFHQDDSTVLALWDMRGGVEGRPHRIQLGHATRQIDLWGRSTPLQRGEDGRHIVRLSPMPVLVDGVDRWLIDVRTSVRFTPDQVSTGTDLAAHTLEMVYQGREPISGRIELLGPKAWKITPREKDFHLMPGRSDGFPVEMRYPHNIAAGRQQLIARLTTTRPSYVLEVPLAIDFGLGDVYVSAMVAREGGDVILTQVVTNRSSKTLQMRGTATVPGRERVYRPFPDLQPGDTQTAEYRFARGSALSGSKVRLLLREVNDGPRTHTVELLVP